VTHPPQRRVRSAAVATVIALCILLSLGVWQLQRLQWKQGLLADIDRAEHDPSVPLRGTPARFAKVFAEGTLLPQTALYGAFVRTMPDGSARMGADRLQLLQRSDGSTLLVDFGWVPTEGGAPPVATGRARIDGYARAAEHPGFLSAEDNAAAHRFYTLDPAAIGTALGVPAVLPFTLVALGPPTDTPPLPQTALPRPPNNHLQYAFTWFGLAAALLGVFAAWARKTPGSAPPP
jgi:surfeit locus 1 family protein